MNEQRQLDLLVELARLVRRFGPDTFDALASMLSDDKLVEKFVDVLSKSANAGRAAREKIKTQKGSPKETDSFRSQLTTIADSDGKKRSLLMAIYDRLQDKTLLPSLADLRRFAADATGSLPNKTSRRTLVISLVKSMLDLKATEIEEKLSAMESASSESDRSLAGWSSVILHGSPSGSRER